MEHRSIKPKISADEVNTLLEDILKDSVKEIEEASSGKIKKVYFFKYKNKDYVIRFSKDNTEFDFEKYLQETMEDEDFPLAKLLHMGTFNNYYYAISEKIKGVTISTLMEEEVKDALPTIMEALTKLHSINIDSSVGYGWLDNNRNGPFNTFTEFLKGFFSNDLEGFWKEWQELFESSFLDYEIFNDLYKKMMELAPYSEGRRYLTHTDFHYNNIIINKSRIAGIIDWAGVSYLDFVFDVAKLVMEFPDYNILDSFQDFYKDHNMDVSNINERFLCAALCHSLDGMRFWAKLGNERAYKAILENILRILTKYGVRINNFKV